MNKPFVTFVIFHYCQYVFCTLMSVILNQVFKIWIIKSWIWSSPSRSPVELHWNAAEQNKRQQKTARNMISAQMCASAVLQTFLSCTEHRKSRRFEPWTQHTMSSSTKTFRGLCMWCHVTAFKPGSCMSLPSICIVVALNKVEEPHRPSPANGTPTLRSVQRFKKVFQLQYELSFLASSRWCYYMHMEWCVCKEMKGLRWKCSLNSGSLYESLWHQHK